MRKRYLCPKHSEKTPSAVVFVDHWYCFGCGASGPLEEIGVTSGLLEAEYVEDLEATFKTINSLPIREVRGLRLRCNASGYFITWPGDAYYKFRRFEEKENQPKYKGPAGHKKIPLVVQKQQLFTLALVEGEINALTLGLLDLKMDIISPGAATDFYSSATRGYLPEWSSYDRVYIVVDNDKAGGRAAIESKIRLGSLGCRDIRIITLDTDFNAVFLSGGREALEKEIRRLGM